MQSPLVVVPFTSDAVEAARLIDAAALPLASVLDPGPTIDAERFRDAVLRLAIEHEGAPAAGVLFASRWGGGGVMLT